MLLALLNLIFQLANCFIFESDLVFEALLFVFEITLLPLQLSHTVECLLLLHLKRPRLAFLGLDQFCLTFKLQSMLPGLLLELRHLHI